MHESQSGFFSFMLRPCTCAILEHILDPTISTVWVKDYCPMTMLKWWNAQVPLSEDGVAHSMEVRQVMYDFQVSTIDFLNLLPTFERSGLTLFQMTRRVPDTLTLQNVTDENRDQILIQNGLHLQFYLPHARECAQVRSVHKDVLVRLLRNSHIRSQAYW